MPRVQGLIYVDKVSRVPSTYHRMSTAACLLFASLVAPSGTASAESPFVVVVDAGHGGHDPGTLSPWGDGQSEKTVTLEIAMNVQAALSGRRGIDVVLTRHNDRFLTLLERRKIAETRRADLFVSIHADSAPSPLARGASVYTLTEDGRVLVVSRMRDGVDFRDTSLGGQDRDVTTILGDLKQRSAMNTSARFAARVALTLAPAVVMRPTFRHVARFAVLKARGIPAVLIETGYLTNHDDARFLFSSFGQRAVSDAIVRAILETTDDNNGLSDDRSSLADK